MDINLADGWVPKTLIYDGDEPVVELVLGGHRSRTKPSLYQDPLGYRETRQIPLRALGDGQDHAAAIRPAGFIFQMSRSGSTAAAHMLAAVERHAVLVEPSPLKDLFSPPTAISEETCVERLRADACEVLLGCGYGATPAARHLVRRDARGHLGPARAVLRSGHRGRGRSEDPSGRPDRRGGSAPPAYLRPGRSIETASSGSDNS